MKEYTHYLKDYAEYDVFAPILENKDSEDFKEKNVFRRKNLSHCILKSILGAIYGKQHNKDSGECYTDFVEALRSGTHTYGVAKFLFEVLQTFSETTIKGCYFNEVLHYVKSIEHAMNKTLYLNVFLEQKTVQCCSIYSDTKAFKGINDSRDK